MKKNYIAPGITVVRLQHNTQMMHNNSMHSVNSDDVGYGGASSNNDGGVRARQAGNIWDDEW